jgi:hypothetical protein
MHRLAGEGAVTPAGLLTKYIFRVKTISIKQEFFNTPVPGMQAISDRLDALGEGHAIDVINWKDYSYKPEVRFNIAYAGQEILLKYYVSEDYFRAGKTETNENVYEDSCVEFFVSPADDGIYYNFEFNAIGTCLLGSGTGRHDSKRAPSAIIGGIRRLCSEGSKPVKETKGPVKWTITIAIPLSLFFHHKIEGLKGRTFRANFYKCGDALPVPHFITWNPIGTPQPDYHQPGYFGILRFI